MYSDFFVASHHEECRPNWSYLDSGSVQGYEHYSLADMLLKLGHNLYQLWLCLLPKKNYGCADANFHVFSPKLKMSHKMS